MVLRLLDVLRGNMQTFRQPGLQVSAKCGWPFFQASCLGQHESRRLQCGLQRKFWTQCSHGHLRSGHHSCTVFSAQQAQGIPPKFCRRREAVAPHQFTARRFAASKTRRGRAARQEALASDYEELVGHRTWQGAVEAALNTSGDITNATALLQERLITAVQYEKAEAKQALDVIYASKSKRRLQEAGVLLEELLLESTGQDLFGKPIWRLSPPAAKSGKPVELPLHKFQKRDDVTLSCPTQKEGQGQPVQPNPQHPSECLSEKQTNQQSAEGWKRFAGTVLEVRRDSLLVVMEDEDAAAVGAMHKKLRAPTWRLDKSVPDVTSARQIDAIMKLSQWDLDQDAPQQNISWRCRYNVRACIVGLPKPEELAATPALWVHSKAWRVAAGQHLSRISDLNDSQRKAIAVALTRCFSLWQGPPGTGKTRTMIAYVDTLVRVCSLREEWREQLGKVLACGDTNAAADNLAEGMAARGLRVVRLGQPARVREELRPLTLEGLVATRPDGKRAQELRENAQMLIRALDRAGAADGAPAEDSELWRNMATQFVRAQMEAGGFAPRAIASRQIARDVLQDVVKDKKFRSVIRKQVDAALKEADALERAAMKAELAACDVVVSTCTTAADRRLAKLKMNFPMVIIDEATQATEPSTLIPLMLGAQCVVMAGDPRQLPPTVISRRAERECGLNVTLFDRLQSNGMVPALLDTQYRMHELIAEFPSYLFYGLSLRTGPGVTAARPPPRGVPWPNPACPVALLPCPRGTERRDAGEGMEDSARRGSAQGRALVSETSYLNVEEARVVVRVLRSLIAAGDVESVALLTPYNAQRRLLTQLLRQAGLDRALEGGVSVSSIDGFQGREADVVVLSTVRSNPDGRLGFVADPRRMNVAITRPRRGLVVVGSPETLRCNANWQKWLTWVETRGCVLRTENVAAAARPAKEEAEEAAEAY